MALHEQPFRCPKCFRRFPLSVNLIIPFAYSATQTLVNMNAVCQDCNRRLGSIRPRAAPFAFPSFVPEKFQNRRLEAVLRDKPDWLGKIDRPASVRDIDRLLHP